MNARGHSLVELMIAVALSTLLGVGVVALYAHQSALARQMDEHGQRRLQLQDHYDRLASLLRQARQHSIRIQTLPTPPRADGREGPDDHLIVDLTLPPGLPLWPNTDGERPAVRIHWRADDGRIRIATARRREQLPQAPAHLLGLASDPPIDDVDLWPLQAPERLQDRADAPPLAGYRLSLRIDRGGGPPVTVSGTIAPRN